MKKKTKELSRMDQLEALALQVNEALGADGKVYVGRDHEPLERVSSGILALDIIMGGGVVLKHYLEVYGAESAGKTTICLQIVASFQRAGLIAAWVIGEEFDDDWASLNGVDVDKLIKIEATTGDLMLETCATYVESGLVDLVVLDSIQALGTKREAEAGIEKESYAGGGAPQMWARFYRRTRAAFNSRKSKAAIIGISQVRDAIGVFSGHGKPEPQPTQIRVIKHWKSISISCKKGEPTYDDPKSDKRTIRCREFHIRATKNKTAPPDRIGTFVYRWLPKPGLDRSDEVVRLAKLYGVLQQGGAVLEGCGVKVRGSKENSATAQVIALVRKDGELRSRMRAAVMMEAGK